MPDQVVDGRFGPRVKDFAWSASDWMAHDGDARIGDLELAGHLIRERDEGVRRDDDRRDATCFQGFRVMETPRRAAASISGPGEDEIGFSSQAVE